jgi:hypothetical protein
VTHAEGPDEWYDCLVRYQRQRALRTPMLTVPEEKQTAEPPLPLP